MSKHTCPHLDRPIFSKGQCRDCAGRRYADKARSKPRQVTPEGLPDIGDEVLTIHYHQRGIVESIDETGLYKLKNDKGLYEANELKLVDQKTVGKPRKPIAQYSERRSELTKIYNIVHLEYMQHTDNQVCKAQLGGCTHKATEVHHTYVRTGYFLIQSHYFLPICTSCHTMITENSEQAIELGLSLLRNIARANIFTEREIELMIEFGVRQP